MYKYRIEEYEVGNGDIFLVQKYTYNPIYKDSCWEVLASFKNIEEARDFVIEKINKYGGTCEYVFIS